MAFNAFSNSPLSQAFSSKSRIFCRIASASAGSASFSAAFSSAAFAGGVSLSAVFSAFSSSPLSHVVSSNVRSRSRISRTSSAAPLVALASPLVAEAATASPFFSLFSSTASRVARVGFASLTTFCNASASKPDSHDSSRIFTSFSLTASTSGGAGDDDCADACAACSSLAKTAVTDSSARVNVPFWQAVSNILFIFNLTSST
mmetsp:Transcript_40353/g.74979  ORF Transcript_40353/g.74979 Transcript_40353/m.74979 type:complete len:203 (+) Transcript_40353:1874-2482(+)